MQPRRLQCTTLCTQADTDDDDRVSEMYYTTHTIALLSCATMLHDPDTNIHYVRVLHVHGSTTHSHERMGTTHEYTDTWTPSTGVAHYAHQQATTRTDDPVRHDPQHTTPHMTRTNKLRGIAQWNIQGDSTMSFTTHSWLQYRTTVSLASATPL